MSISSEGVSASVAAAVALLPRPLIFFIMTSTSPCLPATSSSPSSPWSSPCSSSFFSSWTKPAVSHWLWQVCFEVVSSAVEPICFQPIWAFSLETAGADLDPVPVSRFGGIHSPAWSMSCQCSYRVVLVSQRQWGGFLDDSHGFRCHPIHPSPVVASQGVHG